MTVHEADIIYSIVRDHDGAILLVLQNTGQGEGIYSLPSGQTLPGEAYSAAAVRVAAKEVGAELDQNDVGFTYMQQRYELNDPDSTTVWKDIFFEAGPWKGELHNTDPADQLKIVWFYADGLPENIAPHQRYAIERIMGEHLYGEYGWPATASLE